MSESVEQQMRKLFEQHRAELPDRFDASSLSCKRLGDIRAGNLIYLPLDHEQQALAMRVTRLNGGPPEALVFNYKTKKGEVLHALLTGYANQYCVDWGSRPLVCWHHPIKKEVPDYTQAPVPGTILLSEGHLAIRTYLGHGMGEALYFDLKTGEEVEPAHQFVAITEWSLGARAVNGAFLPLAACPIR